MKQSSVKIKIIFFSLFAFLLMCSEAEYTDPIKQFIPPKFEQLNKDKVALGQRLFFEPRLSETDSISCASCHLPENSFSDNKKFSIGIKNRKGKRNTPPIINAFSQTHFFHDGRAESLEEQAIGPLDNPDEMGDIKKVIPKLKTDPSYVAQFDHVYNRPISMFLLVDAIAEFERALRFANSRFDKFIAGDSLALSADEKAGFDVFMNKGNCVDCHSGWNFTNNDFHNIAFFDKDKESSDKGRFDVTKNNADLGKFKTPTLRNIALTAPYFANGSAVTLREVIDLYNKPMPMGFGHFKDELIKPIHLSEIESFQLLQFLHSLTDLSFLEKFADRTRVDSIIASQNITKADFERKYYLSEYEIRIGYFKGKFASEFENFSFAKVANPTDAEKIEFCKEVLLGSHKHLFENGDHLIWNNENK